LTEYFTLPQKFAFIDVEGIGKGSAFGEPVMRFDLAFRLDKPFPYPANVDKDWVKLHCVPIVNVFPTTAEPIRVEAKRERYLVRPAGIAPEHADVYSIRLVETLLRKTGERFTVPPFLSFARAAGKSVFYVPHLVPSAVGEGADMMVSFGTHEDGGLFPEVDVISMELLATNRALASALRPGEITAPTSTSPPMTTFRNLTAVTPYVAVPIGRELHWRMLAHAAMGLTSFAKVEVLRAALDVYNLLVLVDRQAARANELRMEALKEVRVTPAERLVRGAIVRGVDVNVDAEEAGFLGDGDLFLFSAVLDRLFASYVSINSFSRTSVNGLASKQRYAWPARNGNTTLL
jgi:type VI secretion system protein ImpG